MRRALMLSGALLAGCSAAGYISGGNQQSTGDVWYSRSTYIPLFGVVGSSAPYYCPAPTEPGPARCMQATIDEPVDAPTPSNTAQPSPVQPPREVCNDLVFAPDVPVTTDEACQVGAPPTNTLPLQDGAYSAVTYQFQSGNPQLTRRTMIQIAGARFQMIFRRNDEPAQRISGRWVTTPDGHLSMTATCPQQVPLEFDRYVVTEQGVILFGWQVNKQVVFRREPTGT